MESEGAWADYDSAVMFEGCDCPHGADEHAGWYSDWDGCRLCSCPVEWAHT